MSAAAAKAAMTARTAARSAQKPQPEEKHLKRRPSSLHLSLALGSDPKIPEKYKSSVAFLLASKEHRILGDFMVEVHVAQFNPLVYQYENTDTTAVDPWIERYLVATEKRLFVICKKKGLKDVDDQSWADDGEIVDSIPVWEVHSVCKCTTNSTLNGDEGHPTETVERNSPTHALNPVIVRNQYSENAIKEYCAQPGAEEVMEIVTVQNGFNSGLRYYFRLFRPRKLLHEGKQLNSFGPTPTQTPILRRWKKTLRGKKSLLGSVRNMNELVRREPRSHRHANTNGGKKAKIARNAHSDPSQ